MPTRLANSFLHAAPSFSAASSGETSFKKIPYPRSNPDQDLVIG